MEPEFTLIGGILRYERMAEVVREQLGAEVNVPAGDLAQFTAALGAACWVSSGCASSPPHTRMTGDPVAPLSHLVHQEAQRLLSEAQLSPDPARVADGWERRFIADGPGSRRRCASTRNWASRCAPTRSSRRTWQESAKTANF